MNYQKLVFKTFEYELLKRINEFPCFAEIIIKMQQSATWKLKELTVEKTIITDDYIDNKINKSILFNQFIDDIKYCQKIYELLKHDDE